MPAATTAEPSSVARRWVPLGVAAAIALLAGGTLIGRFALQPDRPTIATHPDRDVLPANYIAAATQIHVRCSRGVEHHPHGGWPKTLVSIEEPVKQYVNNNSQHYPDLSSIGFKYLGCGPCGRPEETGVHLLYRSTAGTDTLSLFIEPFTNQVDLAPGTCCYSRTSDVHPVLVWAHAEPGVLHGRQRKSGGRKCPHGDEAAGTDLTRQTRRRRRMSTGFMPSA